MIWLIPVVYFERDKTVLRLSVIEADDSKIRIFDNKSQRIVEVEIIKGVLQCLNCRIDDCIHVGYALGIKQQKKKMLISVISFPEIISPSGQESASRLLLDQVMA